MRFVPPGKGRTGMRLFSLTMIAVLFTAFAAAQESPHGKITIPCETCHGGTTWEMRKDSPFDHATTGFALVGQHKTVACVSCHQKLVFTRMSSNCTSCHTDVHRT